MRVQIIGLVRFAFNAKNGFRTAIESWEDARSILFEPVRMAFRLRMLEEICLRSMANQTDRDFKLVILTSASLPTRYLNRLKEMTAPLPNVEIVMKPRQWMIQATQAAMQAVVEPDADYVVNFRLDDDDALAIDYIEQTRATAERLIAAGMAEVPTVLAHACGVYWDLAKGEDGLRLRTDIKPLGLACAMITSPEIEVNVFRWNHRDFARHFPMWMSPSQPMYIRSLHRYGDSETVMQNWKDPMAQADMAALLQQRFRFDIEALTHGWPQEMVP